MRLVLALPLLLAAATVAKAQDLTQDLERPVRTYEDGSAVRADFVAATAAALRAETGRRIRFTPTRVASQGRWGVLLAEVNGEESRRLCYDPEADFWSGISGVRVLLFRSEGGWDAVRLGGFCYEDYWELETWARFTSSELIGPLDL